eukprot:478246_1
MDFGAAFTSNTYSPFGANYKSTVQTSSRIVLHKHNISGAIADRYAVIIYSFDFENMNQNGSNELRFELTIDVDAFISKFEAEINGELFISKTKEKESASKEYAEAKEKDENAILISQPYKQIPNVFEIKTNIEAKSKVLLSITIEQFIKKKFGFNELNIQILRNFEKYNIDQFYSNIAIEFDVKDKSGIYDIDIPINNNDIMITENTMDKLNQNCKIKATISAHSSINELTLKFKIKGESDDSYILFDKTSNTFCHIISDIISDSTVVDEKMNEFEGQNAVMDKNN